MGCFGGSLCFVAWRADRLQVCFFVGSAVLLLDDVVDLRCPGHHALFDAGLAQAVVPLQDEQPELVPGCSIAAFVATATVRLGKAVGIAIALVCCAIPAPV